MTSRVDDDEADRRTRDAAAALFATLEVEGHSGAVVEDASTSVLVEPIADSRTGRVDLLVTVTPFDGRRTALSQAMLTLSPLQHNAVTRFGRLDRHGQIVFTAMARGVHRFRLRSPANATATGMALLSLPRAALAADRDTTPIAVAFRSADGSTEGAVRAESNQTTVSLQPPAGPVGEVVLTPLLYRDGSETASTSVLVAQLCGGPSHLPATVNLPRSYHSDELAIELEQPFDPSGLGDQFVTAEADWRELIARSVRAPADRIDLGAWQHLANDERVAPTVRDAIAQAIEARH